MTSITQSFLRSFGKWATTHPETWIYGCAFTGMAISCLIYGGLGFLLGLPLHQSTNCMYAGLVVYALWFITNVDAIKDGADAQVQILKDMNKVPF